MVGKISSLLILLLDLPKILISRRISIVKIHKSLPIALEAAENVKNSNKYWAVRREEKNSLNEGKRIREGDLVLEIFRELS